MTLFPDQSKQIIEGLLLCASDPISAKELGQILDLDPREVQVLLGLMKESYRQEGRGFALTEVAGGWCLTTLPEHSGYIEKLVKPRWSVLSQASAEVLAIVAYRQPVTRSEIEEIRGVNCDSALGTLLERDLIEEKGRKDAPGRPILFGTTTEFLKCFGLVSLKHLPPIQTNNQQTLPL